MFSPTRPLARSVTNAVSGRSRYCAFSGACNDLNSSAVIFYFHAFRRDFKNEKANAHALGQVSASPFTRERVGCGFSPRAKSNFHPSPQSAPLQGGEADSLEPPGRGLARLNVLIHAEEIIRIIFLFDFGEPVVIAAVGFLHAFFAFVAHEEIYICSACRKRMHGIVIALGP